MAEQLHGQPLLRVTGLRKAFGAVQATNNVNIDVRAGEIHALIGPNGAGKSTLISQICGEQMPDSGSIFLDGRDVTSSAAFARARLGLGRSFQITELCADFTALENVVLSVMLRKGRPFGCWGNPRHDEALVAEARTQLAHVGLSSREQVAVADLAHGEKRQLELAVALARRPRLLLLDEPMAGMGAEESASMTRLLRSMKGYYGILLVEHDMDAVFALADRISVLVYGRTIFTGTPDEVRRHPEVRAAYLGEDHALQPALAATTPGEVHAHT
ncbi:ABC transporter ATP-binding protein [Rhodoferax koreense]|uniref:ABC transporter ATP-binding protein n=1 Tax=Rhodoferax koreensis TaxID=1842727 RepID=A0A1P8JZ77_9BURK|nr:ABC transporter ATP-binding protein [Rhodoferax koreense]APW39062.1 ABC transporter ATP-binding protein [Rhodoferax koreense]